VFHPNLLLYLVQVLVFFSMVFGLSSLSVHVLDVCAHMRRLKRAQQRNVTWKSLGGDVMSILVLDSGVNLHNRANNTVASPLAGR
jgi:hypothetical protein